MILVHMQYEKGSKKPKSKGKNPNYIPYHHADVVGGDAGPVPIELDKTILKYWTLRSTTLLTLVTKLHWFFFWCAPKELKVKKTSKDNLQLCKPNLGN